MYCPNCGSNNQAGTKFCARCGTNIAVVADALAGKPSPIDERMLKVIKDYHKGRRDAITGAILIPAGAMIMAVMIAAGLNEVAAFFIICWMFFWGVAALADGVGKWVASSGEMKALGFAPQQGQLPDNRSAAYLTGPVSIPGSVTERTTRQLDEGAYRPPAERQ